MKKLPKSSQLSLESAHVWDDLGGIPPDHWCYAFFKEIYCGLSEEIFAGLYQEAGRAPISPRLCACLTLLQYRFGLSDRQALECAVMRRDWRIALGISAGWEPFSATVLVDFRKRLEGEPIRAGLAAPPDRDGAVQLFNAVLARARALQLLPNTTRVRADATHVVAHVAVLSRVDVVREAMRVVVCSAHDRYQELQANSDFMALYLAHSEERWIGAGNAKSVNEELLTLGLAAQQLLALLGDREAKGKEVLARILQENFCCADGEPLQPLPPDQRPDDRIVTPHDPEARTGKKRGTVWTGDKVHVVETAAEEGPNLIVGVVSTGPRVDDGQALEEIAKQARQALPEVDTVIADAGYASAHNSKQMAAKGIDLVAPPRGDSSTNGVRASEFEINYETLTAICPEGHQSRRGSEKPDEITMRFPGRVCRICRRFGECTTCTQGRTLALHKEHEQLARDRLRAQQPEFKQVYRLRAPIEATFSELTRSAGLRRSRYRGTAGRALHAILACSALNAWRIVRHLSGAKSAPRRARGGPIVLVAAPTGC